MKRSHLLIVFICTTLLLVMALRFLLFTSYIQQQKTEFRAKVLTEKNNDFVSIHLPLFNLYKNVGGMEWKEKNKELVIGGQFFEVVKITIESGEALVILISDDNENELFKSFFNLQINHNSNFDQLAALLFGLQFQETNTTICFSQNSTPLLHNSIITPTTRSGFSSGIAKPPKL